MVNAFHPDYIKTHEPKLMKSFRTIEANRQAAETLTKHVAKKRKTDPLHGFLHGIQKARPSIDVKPFHIYSKAGMPK
jgi:hypothetical protein